MRIIMRRDYHCGVDVVSTPGRETHGVSAEHRSKVYYSIAPTHSHMHGAGSGEGPAFPPDRKGERDRSRRAKRRRDLVRALIAISAVAVAIYFSTLPTPPFFASVLTYYTILMLVVVLFSEQIRLFLLRFRGSTAVVCGLGDKGSSVVKQFLDAGSPVIAIEKDPGNKEIEVCRSRGAAVIVGDARDYETLGTARIGNAEFLLALTGDDGVNGEIALRACDLRKENARRALACVVHLSHPALCALLRERELASSEGKPVRLEFFNIHQRGAFLLLRAHPPFLPGLSSPPDTSILIIGMGDLGEGVMVHAAKLWKEGYGSSAGKLRIALLDREAEALRETFLLRYPSLERYADLLAFPMDLRSPGFLRLLSAPPPIPGGRFGIIYLCIPDESLGLATALEIQRSSAWSGTQVVVRTVHSGGILSVLEMPEGGKELQGKIHPFPLVDRTCSLELVVNGTHEMMARAIHEEYVLSRFQAGQVAAPGTRIRPWEELPEEYREANRAQADEITRMLRRAGSEIAPMADWDESPLVFTAGELESLAEEEHLRWMRERTASGWIFGEARDDERKLHPSLIPWADLPEAEKEKDRNAIRVLPGILARVDLAIRRVPLQGQG
jgi:voltage-gated potassium channel Kch